MKTKAHNPAVSASQYGAAQAVRAGKSRIMPRRVAKKLIAKTPPAKRRQFAAQLAARRRRNQPSAGKLSEIFHGRPVQQIALVEQSVRERTQLAELGELVSLQITTPAGDPCEIDTEGRGVVLAASPSGGQLYLMGGDQEVDPEDFGIEETGKDKVLLGAVDEITYLTAKALDDFELHDYFHELGEESGERPLLVYDRLNRMLELVDGHYSTRAEGLID